MSSATSFILQELKAAWRGLGYEAQTTALSGPVWSIKARLLTDGSGPVFDLETQCDVMDMDGLRNFVDFSCLNYEEAEQRWGVLERFSSMPFEELALHVNETDKMANFVMSRRLSKIPCGDDISTCMCDSCPMEEVKDG